MNSRALLIDVDNCGNQIEELPKTLKEFSRIIACYGSNDPKVHLSLIPLLASAIHAGTLEIVGMRRKGKNAADFGLAFCAGRLAAEMPPETEFLILSQDTDLEYVVDMLRSLGRKVRRIDGKTNSAVPVQPPPRDNPPALNEKEANDEDIPEIADPAERYFVNCLRESRNRPTRRTALSNSIRSFYRGDRDVRPGSILRGLVRQGLIMIDDQGRVSYSKKKLAE